MSIRDLFGSAADKDKPEDSAQAVENSYGQPLGVGAVAPEDIKRLMRTSGQKSKPAR